MHNSMYASQRPPSGKAAKILGASEDFSGVPPPPKNPFHNYTDLLEPSLDGPPSPERLRQLSQEMRRGSHADVRRGSHADIRRGSQADIRHVTHPEVRRGSVAEKRHSQHTTSSGSSSLLSSDRPSWEHGLEQISLSRKSSQRSTSSGVPSREGRPESLQIFGKSLFNRKGKLREESSDQGSSIALQQPKAQKAAPTPAPERTQNVTSPQLCRIYKKTPSVGGHVRKTSELQAPQMRQHRYSPPAPIRPLPKRATSEEQMRGPPPRPPRSPIGMSWNTPAVVPPPRLSSRAPSRDEEIDPLERPMTNCSSRQPQPFLLSPAPTMPEPPATAQGLISDFLSPDDVVEQQIGSHAITTPDDAAWPLTANVLTSLPNVPEEEEGSRQDCTSLTSNNSSLRGSISAPLLRRRPQPPAPGQGNPSNASETLGKFDMLAAQRLMRASIDEDGSVYEDSLNWEDDIDYCYEHAAEADFDYAWERPSCDMGRGEDEDAQSPKTTKPGSSRNSAGLPGGHLFRHNKFDVPALSPASQTSLASSQGAITPTLQQGAVTSNFSLPRRDSSTLAGRGHSRVPSRVAAFKESQGFISPSLLVPNDYHQQMLLHESELREEDEDGEAMYLSHGTSFLDPADFKSANARASSSTTHSALSDSSSRHRSATSNSTAFTRWTASSTSTSIESWQAPSEDSEITAKMDNDDVSPLPVFQDVFKRDASRERHHRAQSHANVLAPNDDDIAPHEGVSPVPPVKSRRRARTTSRSHNNPPAQFGLFPRSSVQ
ncbi:hypothetical protein PG991_008567 [Apiospora marii]|uniref:Uncharacterized protein n=1 Tax=Apiospora marii TaxID=335849 RepID=A0ABR1RMD7_9PEZI